MEYLFTIGIIVCDKDFKYIDNLLSEIGSKISGKYNIIIYNNCDINYDALSNLKSEAIVLPNTYKHRNARQVYARKMITEKAFELKSDYIWFIDADDLPKEVDFNNLESYSDIILFPYETNTNSYFHFFKNFGTFKVEKNRECFNNIGSPLWCKIIKTEIFKKIYDLIDAGNLPPMSCSEDTLASLLSLKFAKEYSCISSSLYFNNNERGDSNNRDIHLNNIKNSVIGAEQFFELTDSLFTEEEKESLEIKNIRFGTIFWILNRICLIKDDNERDEALKFVNSSIDDKYKDEYIEEC